MPLLTGGISSKRGRRESGDANAVLNVRRVQPPNPARLKALMNCRRVSPGIQTFASILPRRSRTGTFYGNGVRRQRSRLRNEPQPPKRPSRRDEPRTTKLLLGYSQHHHSMLCHRSSIRPICRPNILMLPKITNFCRPADTNRRHI